MSIVNVTGEVAKLAMPNTTAELTRPRDKQRLGETLIGVALILIALAVKFTVGLGDFYFFTLVIVGAAGFDRHILLDALRVVRSEKSS